MYDRINVASKTKKILDSAFDEPISVEDGNYLMNLKGSEIYPLLATADAVREEIVGDKVTFINNCNINFTNICHVRCGFCAFGKDPDDPEAYLLDDEGILNKAEGSYRDGAREFTLMGGVLEDATIEYYEHLLKLLKSHYPKVEIHGFSPTMIRDAALNSEIPVDERARAGIFLGLQYPKEISGVTNSDFLRAAMNATSKEKVKLFKFIKEMDTNIRLLKMKDDLAHRFVNDGFSGGEKKRNEILQMMMLKPKLAMLDEIDSGLDVDAIKLVSDAILKLKEETGLGLMVVSHYERFFTALKPTHSHVIVDGKVVIEGDDELVMKIDQEGYDWLYDELKIQPVKENKPLVYSLGTCARNKGTK